MKINFILSAASATLALCLTGCVAPAPAPVQTAPPTISSTAPAPITQPVFNTNNAILGGLNSALQNTNATPADIARAATLGAINAGFGAPNATTGAAATAVNPAPVNQGVK